MWKDTYSWQHRALETISTMCNQSKAVVIALDTRMSDVSTQTHTHLTLIIFCRTQMFHITTVGILMFVQHTGI